MDNWLEDMDVDGFVESCITVPAPQLAGLLKVRLNKTDWMITRHQEQVLSGTETSLSAEEFAMLVSNRNKIRVAIGNVRATIVRNNPVDE